jgi:hypothetical protein
MEFGVMERPIESMKAGPAPAVFGSSPSMIEIPL